MILHDIGMIACENTDMCQLCFATDDVILTKNCNHLVCLRCLTVNDYQHCPVSECRKKLHAVDLHRKHIYIRSGEILGRKILIHR